MADKNIIPFYYLLLSLLIPGNLLAQSSIDDAIVGKVGSDEITYSELKENFNQGNASTFSLSDLQDFLPLYLDYKAKLMLAKDQGYFSDSTVVAEHSTYSKQAAYAYWLNNEIRPTLFKKYYERAKMELKAFHVLIAAPENASKEEIEAIKKQLQQAKSEIENGATLEEVDRKYSTKRGGRSMGGDLPWISAGRTVKPFEDALYDLEPGQISEPIETQFGYHIILLQDKRERTPAKKLSHIYVRSTQDSSALLKANEAYKALEDGGSWNDVLMKYTEDGASAPNGGDIGWVSYRSNYAISFLDQVKQLDLENAYSEPINTVYGYHIFKVDSVQTFTSEEHRKEVFMQEFEQSNYFQESNAFAVEYLKEEFGSQVHEEAAEEYAAFVADLDSTLINSVSLPEKLSEEVIFEFNDQKFLVKDYHSYNVMNNGNHLSNNYRASWFDNFTQNVIDSQVIDLTLNTYPEFSNQINSYLNGLVVYQVNNDFLWSPETVDSTRLQSLYESNVELYSYDRRPYFYMLSANRDSVLTKAINFVNEGNHLDSVRTFDKRVAVSSDSISSYQDEPFNKLMELEPNSFSDVFEYNNRKAVFYLKEWLPARRMTFEESFNRLLAEYQPEREKQWIESLRKKYKVEVDLKTLESMYKAEHK